MVQKNWVYQRGDIYYADLDPVIGSEQGGIRPVVILQNDTGNWHSSTVIVATVTTKTAKKESQPTHLLIKNNPAFRQASTIQLEQVRTIDKKRLKEKVCHLDCEVLKKVDKALTISLELDT